jgi:hypothetical protein
MLSDLAGACKPKASRGASCVRRDAAVDVTKLDTLLRMLASASKNSSGPIDSAPS